MKRGVFLNNKNKYDAVLKELYNDFLSKRNGYKIEIDNYETEIEIVTREIECRDNMEDESRLFSPRENDRRAEDSLENLEIKKEQFEIMLDECRDKFEYYDEYCNKLKPLLENEEISESKDPIETVEKTVKDNSSEDIVYNLSLNYDYDGVKDKLESVIHKLDVCLKIFDNDNARAKNEIKGVKKSVKKILDQME